MQSAFCVGRKCVRPARHEDLPRAGASDTSGDSVLHLLLQAHCGWEGHPSEQPRSRRCPSGLRDLTVNQAFRHRWFKSSTAH